MNQKTSRERIEHELRASLRWLMVATLVLALVLVILGAFFFVDAENRRNELESVARNTNKALCSLRQDLEQRVEAAEAFLEENPEGIRGISAEFIHNSIRNQQRTITALGSLDCPPDPKQEEQ